MQEHDKCSKYSIQHHGNCILRLAGVHDIPAWTPFQAELVVVRRFPDGVLEVRCPGQIWPDIFIIEVASIYQEIVEEAERKGAIETRLQDLLDVLVSRFGAVAQDLEVELRAVEFDRLDDLGLIAARCRNLASFRKRLLS
ncbi:MAG TPA: hypothetical protein VFF52_14085 [Isosphaeraceae bacterium]|nr:hypothetical protein [Isosphaeraceae bacterium]